MSYIQQRSLKTSHEKITYSNLDIDDCLYLQLSYHTWARQKGYVISECRNIQPL